MLRPRLRPAEGSAPFPARPLSPRSPVTVTLRGWPRPPPGPAPAKGPTSGRLASRCVPPPAPAPFPWRLERGAGPATSPGGVGVAGKPHGRAAKAPPGVLGDRARGGVRRAAEPGPESATKGAAAAPPRAPCFLTLAHPVHGTRAGPPPSSPAPASSPRALGQFLPRVGRPVRFGLPFPFIPSQG